MISFTLVVRVEKPIVKVMNDEYNAQINVGD